MVQPRDYQTLCFLHYMYILRDTEFFFIRNDQFSSIILQNMVLKRAEFQGHQSVMLTIRH